MKWHLSDTKKYAFTFITLFAALIIIFWNSFYCQWQLDDFPNIVDNQNIHLETLSWENIQKTFHGIRYDQKMISRPLSYLTFALNYHMNGANVFGYHAVNLAIHYLASIFLFLFIYNTLRLPLLNERYGKTAYAVALLSVFFWAIHPVQVTAVTYIVQRMTSMAGMFYVMAMYFYLKCRTASEKKNKLGFFMLCNVTAIFSFASKENAFMLPASLFLYDLFLLQGLTDKNVKKNLKIVILPLLIILTISFFFIDLSSIISGYKHRPFTLSERLLTEPRVILFYISLILYPINSRLTMLHDFEISRSLFSPWTTFPAVLAILLIIAMVLWVCRKRALIAYCIFFFFLNHLIEGSIIPLELIFEHRNYLPSMLVFVPVAILAINTIDYFSYKKLLQFIMSFLVVFLLTAQGHTTHMRNALFSNSIALWTDNINKAPDLHRPRHNLGKALLVAGYYEEGLSEMQKALKARAGGRTDQKYMTHYNLGIYYLYQNEHNKALYQFVKSLDHLPRNPRAFNKIATIMLYRNSLKLAEKYIKKAIRLDPYSSEFHKTLDLILLKKGNKDNAITKKSQAHKKNLTHFFK